MGEEGCHRLRCGRRGTRASFLPGSGTQRKQVNNLARPRNTRPGKREHSWGIPSPRSGGIIDLEENREIIYGAQWFTGKILSRKELDPSGQFPRTRFRLG